MIKIKNSIIGYHSPDNIPPPHPSGPTFTNFKFNLSQYELICEFHLELEKPADVMI